MGAFPVDSFVSKLFRLVSKVTLLQDLLRIGIAVCILSGFI
jgi:hypothetical protein